MGVAWFALGLFAFTWALAWLNKRLRDAQQARRRSWQEWIGEDDDDD